MSNCRLLSRELSEARAEHRQIADNFDWLCRALNDGGVLYSAEREALKHLSLSYQAAAERLESAMAGYVAFLLESHRQLRA